MCKLGRAGWLIYALESLYRRLPSYFVVVNGEVADGIRKTLPRAQVYLTSNAFDPALLEVVDTSHASPPFLLFIGRIDVFMKGLDLLIEAFAALASKYPELSLVIAGKGDQASEAALLALARQYGLEHRISLRKNVSDQEKQELLSACLLVCSPSRFEGFGIAVLEASAAGKPVVVSQASGFAHSVRQGYSGIRVDIAEKQNLPQALMGLLEDPEKRIRMGRQARDWALRFTWDSIAKREAQWLGSHLGWGG